MKKEFTTCSGPSSEGTMTVTEGTNSAQGYRVPWFVMLLTYQKGGL